MPLFSTLFAYALEGLLTPPSRCGEDETQFVEMYPAAGRDRISELHNQIRASVAKRRTSKNGSYEARLG